MKRIILTLFLVLCLSGVGWGSGMGHHPTWHRYGYLPLPLTSWTTRDRSSGASPNLRATASNLLNETDFEGETSLDEAIIGREGGKPAILLGKTSEPIEISFPIPDDYWRDGQIEMFTKNTNSVGESLAWSIKSSTASSPDTSPSIETDVTTSSPSGGYIAEKLTFDVSDEESQFKENRFITFTVNKKNAGTQCTGYPCSNGTLFIYEPYFKYEKKKDS